MPEGREVLADDVVERLQKALLHCPHGMSFIVRRQGPGSGPLYDEVLLYCDDVRALLTEFYRLEGRELNA